MGVGGRVTTPPLPLSGLRHRYCASPKNEWYAHGPCEAHGYDGHIPATSCAPRMPSSNPPYSGRASVPPASLREDPTSPRIVDKDAGTKAAGEPDACSRRVRDREPAKVKMEHEVGKGGKSSTMAQKGRESRKAEAIGTENRPPASQCILRRPSRSIPPTILCSRVFISFYGTYARTRTRTYIHSPHLRLLRHSPLSESITMRAQSVIGAQKYTIPVGAEVCRTAEWEVGHRAEGRAGREWCQVERTPAAKDADARVQEGAVQRGVEDPSAVRIPTRARVEKQCRGAIRAPQGQHYQLQKVQQKGEVDKELRTKNTAVSSPAAKAKTQAN
ncbi:hypothetical protein B0H14DRAFT_3889446 [Mycena olivaceomarginata]|nr:hypothetical protein B0H14DRAFT_3889446 [Mycena olivaceomarginata]